VRNHKPTAKAPWATVGRPGAPCRRSLPRGRST